jgi:outer membrane protein OmpA-like peptidoglycan-associated protein
MRNTIIGGAVASAFLAGCASMPSAELNECLQPNRRVVVEVGGTVLKPKPKPKPAAEGEKPAPKAEAAPAKKPAKPQYAPLQLNALAQGNSAFDPGSAVLKAGGQQELDELVATIGKRKMNVGSIIIAGHTDRFEAESANATLAEERAKAVASYLAAKGMDQKLMFWEGKGAKEPVPVTKFCE